MPTQEDVKRPPERFVRELSPEEGAELKRISKRASTSPSTVTDW
jgi:hypothetical protein